MSSVYTRYGNCRGCGQWVKRDDMLSINVCVYDKENVEERIRLRLCEKCCDRYKDGLLEISWNNKLKTAVELQADPELAALAGLPYDPDLINHHDVDAYDEPYFDSEEALRKRGVKIDIEY